MLSGKKLLQISQEINEPTYVTQPVELPIYKFDLTNYVNTQEICHRMHKLLSGENIFERHNRFRTYGSKTKYLFDFTIFKNLFEEIHLRLAAIENKDRVSLSSQLTNNILLEYFWITMIEKDGEVFYHAHVSEEDRGTKWSTVFYPEDSSNPSPIIFKDKDDKELSIVPKKNMLIIFPASLYHKVERAKSTEKRYSIAANWK